MYNYTKYLYTSNTDYEYIYTTTSTNYSGETSYTSISNDKDKRTKTEFTYESTSDDTLISQTINYDSDSGLTTKRKYSYKLKISDDYDYTYSYEGSYSVQFLRDEGGAKIYKWTTNSYISNGTSQDPSTFNYSEIKKQKGIWLEEKIFSSTGEQNSTYTYTLSDDPVIRKKLGNYELTRYTNLLEPEKSYYNTVEVLSDSATELVIRRKTFTNNILSSQSDLTYEKQ